jgi:translation elongation factor EF-Ts
MAKEWLRKQGIKSANLKSSREASEGLIGVIVRDNFGHLIEVF